MKSFKQYIIEAKTPKLPKIKKGDTILTGKWKNSPAIVKGFGKDKNNQPTVKTNKGIFNLYKFRIKKLMESENIQEGVKELLAAGLLGISALTPHNTMASQKPQITKTEAIPTTTKTQNKTQEIIIQLGKFFVKNGFRVGSHSHFDLNRGYVPEGNQRIGKHTNTSLHYTNRALDVSARGKSQEEMKTIFNHLYKNRDKYGIHELIYAPSGHYNYKRGFKKDVTGHTDHIHIGFKQ